VGQSIIFIQTIRSSFLQGETTMKHKFSVSLTLALVLAMLVTSLAVASDVDVAVVDVTAPTGSVTLAPGGSGTITINMTVTGRQANPATFDVYRDWTLSDGAFTGSNPQTFTVPARAATDPATTFSTSGTVTVDSGQGAGTFTLAVSALNIVTTAPAALAEGDPSAYTISVEIPTPSDTTPPSISYVLTPPSPDGSNGWYTSDVTLTWIVDEPESPSSLVKTGCLDQNITADQFETAYSCSATSDGGPAGPVTVSIKRDATDPEVSLVGGPADGSSHYFGFVPAAPTCDASDVTSGLAGACSVSGYGDTVGNHTVTASAFDNAGNEGTDSASYTVLAWTLNGFYRPVEMGGVWNTVKGGSTVPLKFNVFAGATELTDVGVVKSFAAVKVACEVGGAEDDVEFTTTGGTSLRYDWTDGQFIQNWKTPKSTGCYRVTMTTQDLSTIIAFFKLK
jgi:hypothetical protein